MANESNLPRCNATETSFVFIPPPSAGFQSTFVFQKQISESLESAAIPIILTDQIDSMPFTEIIDWKRIVLIIQPQLITSILYIAQQMALGERFERRRRCRDLWVKYFSSIERRDAGILEVMRQRVHAPRSKLPRFSNKSDLFVPKLKPFQTVEDEHTTDEYLGPIEPSVASGFYQDLLGVDSDDLFTDFAYPATPWVKSLPLAALLSHEYANYRSIGAYEGAQVTGGFEFSRQLGGNFEYEQFTIIIPTYQRVSVLIESLQRLKNLAYLNKVIVVWNDAATRPDSGEIIWPDIGVRIEVHRMSHNSLNNRFLPFESVETEAILSLDDDSILRHDEIVFAFRVWRENRQRIVGFPGRYHALEKERFSYHSAHSCQLSMVLTGAAFIHYYYLFAYSYFAPPPVRSLVDEFINCEDIAMNFLVAYISRQPPIKVTSRWTFACSGCAENETLSMDEQHFSKRSECVHRFSLYFGYNPLLFTQSRADSVLFKTRLPNNFQKCFSFV